MFTNEKKKDNKPQKIELSHTQPRDQLGNLNLKQYKFLVYNNSWI